MGSFVCMISLKDGTVHHFCYGWSARCTAHSRCRRCGDGNMTRRGQPLGCTYLAHFFCISFHPLGMLICALFVSLSLRPKTLSSRMQDRKLTKKKITITLDHGCRHVPRLFLNESVGIDKRGQVITTVPCTIDDHYVVTQLYFLFGS